MTAEGKATVAFNLTEVNIHSYVEGEQEWYKDDILEERRVFGLKVDLNRPENELGFQAPIDSPRPKQRIFGHT